MRSPSSRVAQTLNRRAIRGHRFARETATGQRRWPITASRHIRRRERNRRHRPVRHRRMVRRECCRCRRPVPHRQSDPLECCRCRRRVRRHRWVRRGRCRRHRWVRRRRSHHPDRRPRGPSTERAPRSTTGLWSSLSSWWWDRFFHLRRSPLPARVWPYRRTVSLPCAKTSSQSPLLSGAVRDTRDERL
jgi:hypothetical protein